MVGDLIGSRFKTLVAVVPLTMVGAGVAAQTGEPLSGPSSTAELQADLAPAVPDEALHDPASTTVAPVQRPAELAASVRMEHGTASMHEIPAAALAAYQRAEAVMSATDPSCQLRWQLLAAIGRIESDHGRFAGSQVAVNGLVQPAIFGRRLDGTHSTSRILDTDGGRHDRDARFDRAMGPMQFIPATWSVVGVDADGDSRRDPQDIDDAALSAGVYLCSGDEDLSTTPGVRAAVYRYNHSAEYVGLVLALYKAYSDAAPMDADILPPTYAVDSVQARPTPMVTPRGDRDGDGRTVRAQAASPTTQPTPSPTTQPSPAASPSNPSGSPSSPASPSNPSSPASPSPSDPTTPAGPSDPAEPTPSDPATPPDPSEPAEPTPSDPPAECPAPADTDGDGVTDDQDTDADGDSVDDDTDADGVTDVEDTDIDGDGALNADDADSDGDGIEDGGCPFAPTDDAPTSSDPAESTAPEPTATP